MEQDKLKTLEDMIGGYYRHEGKRKLVRDVTVKGNIATIITDLGDIQVYMDDLDNELQVFSKVKENALVKNESLTEVVLQNNSVYGLLTSTLLDTIEKIQANPDYIAQAEAINNTIKSAIELEKVKVATLSLLK